MPSDTAVILLLVASLLMATASAVIAWRTLRHLRRAARKATQSMWSLHAGTNAAPDARGRLFYLRLADPKRNRFRIGSLTVRQPAGAGASAVEFRPLDASGRGGYRHLSFKRVLSLNHEITDRKIYEPGVGGTDHPGEGRVYFFVTPRPGGFWRRRLPDRLVVEIRVEEVAPDRDVHRLRLTSDPVAWADAPDAAG
ncbi:hypothetical protein [Methylobacterium isbiliense]|jgi:hypothetical protein|uniref:Uncharacterized protein n=1 Tax=Methylobacterium isbiliense TaxID=315478 RepID=A0ABQ4SAI4_9HYPH|nr:hypothetical protein [Methylobacterium isbiliense]MDN3622922.1 hypothetical protein [Methylobacterium isbiliense]GJD98793.1 hypothetical protein GMJLKIPL_0704 [Methylobacterium isbiliense]